MSRTRHYIQQSSTFFQPDTSKITSSSKHITTNLHRNTRFFKNDRWRAFGSCIVHIPPIAVTVALVSLNAREVFYEEFDTPGQSLRLNALQFTAKLHELSIVLSLSTIAISIVQFEILRGGLPLDGVLAGFQITNLSSLWSGELRPFDPSYKLRRLGYILSVVILVVLTATVGPSSAILMLPSIGWWDFPPSLNEANWISFYFAPNETELWPPSVTQQNFWPPGCEFVDTIIPFYCPAGGLELFISQADAAWNFILHEQLKSYPSNGRQVLAPAYDRIVQSGFLKNLPYNVGNLFISGFWAETVSISATKILETITYFNDGYYKWPLHLFNGSQPLAPRTFCSLQFY